MTKTATATKSPTEGSLLARIRSSKTAPFTISMFVKILSLAVVAVVDYLLATIAAVQGVPLVMGFVRAGTGVSMDMPFDTVVSVWIVPALFFVALLLVLVLTIMRAIWRLRNRLVAKLTGTVYGEGVDVVEVPRALGVATPRQK